MQQIRLFLFSFFKASQPNSELFVLLTTNTAMFKPQELSWNPSMVNSKCTYRIMSWKPQGSNPVLATHLHCAKHKIDTPKESTF